jgi:hypothetical protein
MAKLSRADVSVLSSIISGRPINAALRNSRKILTDAGEKLLEPSVN